MKKPKPTLEGFSFWFTVNGKAKQRKYLQYAIRRLAKEHPEADPRSVLLHYFAEEVYRYEEHLKRKFPREKPKDIKRTRKRPEIFKFKG